MAENTAADVVQQYHDAWTNNRIDEAMALVADDIVCRAPGQDITGIEAYTEFIGGFAPMLTGIEEIGEFSDGDRIVRLYYPQTAETGTTPAAELFTVRDGKITETVLMFDRLSYGPPPQ